jgi:hypothetical protein
MTKGYLKRVIETLERATENLKATKQEKVQAELN